MQDCSNSIANALELLQSCTKPSICTLQCQFYPYPSGLHHVTDLVPLKQPEQCRQIWEINFNSLRSVILNETESYAHGTLVGSSCRYHSYIPGNSLALERCGCNLELVIFKLISRRDILSISCEISIMWMVAHDSVVTWVSWHLHFDCLFNGLFSYKFCITGFLRGIHWWLLDSPHKELLMQKPFPCHNVIIKLAAKENESSPLLSLCEGTPSVNVSLFYSLVQSLVQVESLGEFGVFFILFAVGLEFSPDIIRKVSLINPLISLINPLVSLINPLVSLINPLVSLINPLVSLMNPLVSLINPLVSLINPLVSLINPLVSLINPLVSLINPLVRLINPLVSLINTLVSVINPLVSLINTLVSVINPLVSLINPPVSLINTLVSVINPLVSLINPPVSLINPLVSVMNPPVSVMNPLVSVINPLVSLINPLVSLINLLVSLINPQVPRERSYWPSRQ